MSPGDQAIYYHRTYLSSDRAKEKVSVIIRSLTEHKAKVTRRDNGKVMWVNKENITVVETPGPTISEGLIGGYNA